MRSAPIYAGIALTTIHQPLHDQRSGRNGEPAERVDRVYFFDLISSAVGCPI